MPENFNEYVDMNALFYPKTIAVIGVSKNKVGGMKFVFANQEAGFMDMGGKMFPINPKYKELYGYKVYPSLFDPEVPEIDLVIIAVPAAGVPDVIRDCGKKKVKYVIIFSSGFGESGKDANQEELERAVSEVKTTTRIIGPNCLGINNPYSGIHYFPGMLSNKGNVSYISMSGGLTARLTVWLSSQGLGVRHVVSIGNSVDLSATDFINYFREDPQTKVIALYIESIPDGRKFIEAVKKTTPIKPVILWKGGQTEVGASAARSHTGGLAGSFDLWKAMAKQYGVILVDHFEQFADLVTVFSVEKNLPENKNVGLILAGGGIGVEYADICVKNGLKVPQLSKETQEGLGKIFPDVNTNLKNPVDTGEYGYVPDYFAKALKAVASDPNIGSILFVREADRFKAFEEVLGIPNIEDLTIKLISDVLMDINKPAFCSTSPNNQEIEEYTARFNFKNKMLKENLPVIDYIPNVCVAIKNMVDYNKFLKKCKNEKNNPMNCA